MKCNQCNGPMTVGPSEFPGWKLLQCADCGRPVRLLSEKEVRLPTPGRGDMNRALRAARRAKAKER